MKVREVEANPGNQRYNRFYEVEFAFKNNPNL